QADGVDRALAQRILHALAGAEAAGHHQRHRRHLADRRRVLQEVRLAPARALGLGRVPRRALVAGVAHETRLLVAAAGHLARLQSAVVEPADHLQALLAAEAALLE